MKKEDLDALASLYEGVYSPAESGEYLIEAPQIVPAAARLNQQTTKPRPGESAADARIRASAIEDSRRGSVVGQLARTLTRGFGSNKDIARVDAEDKASQARINQRVAASQGKYYSSSDGKTYANYNDAVAARNSRLGANNKPEVATKPKPGLGDNVKPATQPAARPGTGAKVAPTAAAKPAGQTGDKAKDMATWAKANPKLAAAQAERDRTRGTSATTNPLMQDMKSKLPAPKAPSPTTASTAFSQKAPALGSSSAPVQSAGSATTAKPTTNQTATAFSSPSLARSTPSTTPKKPMTQTQSFEWPSAKTIRDIANAYASIYEAKKKDQDQDGDEDFADVMIARMMASGMSRAEAIAAVKNKEYNEEFVTEDPVQDFRDMRRAKENAAGLRGSELSNSARPAGSAAQKPQPRSREFEKVLPSGGKPKPSGGGSAAMRPAGPSSPGYDTRRLGGSDLRRLSNSYEFEGSILDKYIGEAAKRTPKKVRGAKPSDKEWQRGRSDAGKRISGDEDTGPRHYTLGRARGAAVDAPTPPGAKPKNTPKLAGWEKDDIQYRKANLKAGRTHKVGGEKGLPEEYEIYEIVASYLLENNFAETLNDANAIIENMSENWLEEIIEQSAIASRTAAVVDDQRRGSHGMAHDQRMTGDSIKKLKRYKGPRVTPGLPEA